MKNQPHSTNKRVLKSHSLKESAKKQATYLILKPAGYPLRLVGDENINSNNIVIDNPKLFSEYGKAQWGGLSVSRGDFLFDSMIFPDFAFRVVKVHPTNSEIGIKTRIELELPRKQNILKENKETHILFDDIIGQKTAKEKCKIIQKFLINSELRASPWSPRNVLFYGPPGTGKTMMARALASVTSSNYLSIKASELIGVYVGEGSKKIQNLYEQAQKNIPCIIFIDELDAIALKRNYQSVRGDVVEIVSSLLGELDGFHSTKGIVTIAATNIVSEIDPAVISRFEEVIEFKLPSKEERELILKEKAKTSPIPFDVDWKIISSLTHNWSGRDLVQRLLKTAIHQAVLHEKQDISFKDLEQIIKAIQKEQQLNHYI